MKQFKQALYNIGQLTDGCIFALNHSLYLYLAMFCTNTVYI